MNTVLWIAFLSIIIILLLLLIISYCIFREFFTNQGKPPDERNVSAVRRAANAFQEEEEKWFFGCNPQVLSLQCEGLSLCGYYLDQKSPQTVLLIHGWHDTGYTRTAHARFYAEELGYNVFIPNLRCHGRSAGTYIGMGGRERKDILRWIELLEEKYGKKKLVLDGQSMGASTVLALSGDKDIPGEVKAIISDSGFSSVRALVPSLFQRVPALLVRMLTGMITFWCLIFIKDDFTKETPLMQAALSLTPILIIHGRADTFVPFAMAEEIYQAIQAPKEKLYVDGAEHIMSYWVDREAYNNAIREFLNKFVQ